MRLKLKETNISKESEKLKESYAIIKYWDADGYLQEKIFNGTPKSIENRAKRLAEKYEIVAVHQASSDLKDNEYLNSLGEGIQRVDFWNSTFEPYLEESDLTLTIDGKVPRLVTAISMDNDRLQKELNILKPDIEKVRYWAKELDSEINELYNLVEKSVNNLKESIKESALNTKYYVVSYPESNEFCETYKTFTKYEDAYDYLITHVDAEKIFECYDSKSGAYIEKLDKTRDLEDKGKIPISSEREVYLQKVEEYEDDLNESLNESNTPNYDPYSQPQEVIDEINSKNFWLANNFDEVLDDYETNQDSDWYIDVIKAAQQNIAERKSTQEAKDNEKRYKEAKKKLAELRKNHSTQVDYIDSLFNYIKDYEKEHNITESEDSDLGFDVIQFMYNNYPDAAYIGDGKLSDDRECIYFDRFPEEAIDSLFKEFGNKVTVREAHSEYAPEIKKTIVVLNPSGLEESDKLNELDTWVDPRSRVDGWTVKILDVSPDEKGNAVAKVELFDKQGKSCGEDTTFINRKKVKIGETYPAYIDGIMAMPRVKGVPDFTYDEIKGKGKELYTDDLEECDATQPTDIATKTDYPEFKKGKKLKEDSNKGLPYEVSFTIPDKDNKSVAY